MTTATNLIDIPFNKLVLWDGNVRKTGVETGLDELAASIEAHGLLNPLLVRKGPKGKYAVIAGQRRYRAIQRLTKAGTMDKMAIVPCHLRDEGQDDAELSLAENVVRVAMHPADQFEAWRGLIDGGASVPDIAARFGAAESTVRKRLALARVSPRIFACYRDGELPLESLQAFTITDDHALQERIWDGLSDYERDNARSIRAALTEADVPCGDKRVRFVGLEAYETAGGTVRRDLFDAEDEGYAQDVALLDTLTRQKLEAYAADVKKEGWKWVETRTSFGWTDQQPFDHAQPATVALPKVVQAEADQLQAELDALCNADSDSEEEQTKAFERIQAIESRLEDIEAMASVWPDDVKARAGAVVYLARDGVVDIERGLIREDDAEALAQDDENGDAAAEPNEAKGGLPASLIEELTAQKTAALRIEVARSPDIALVLVTHALASSVFYRSGDGVLKARLSMRSLERSVKEPDTCAALLALDAERERIKGILPDDPADLWDWCLKALRDDLLNVLAVAAAHGVDTVVSKAEANHGGREQGRVLSLALNLDMAQWYRPTVAGYFGRIGKPAILADLEAMRQAPCAPSWFKMKKGELGVLAEREAAERGWLPAWPQ